MRTHFSVWQMHAELHGELVYIGNSILYAESLGMLLLNTQVIRSCMSCNFVEQIIIISCEAINTHKVLGSVNK